MKRKNSLKKLGGILLIALVASLILAVVPGNNYMAFAKVDPKPAGQGDPAVLALMHKINDRLAAQGRNIAVEEIEFFTIGKGRPVNRIHKENFSWVAGDTRRLADGDNITYLVDESRGATSSGLTNAQTEAAIDRAFATWQADKCLKKVTLVKRPYTGADPDIVDWFFGFGGFGNPFLADIVDAGWMPKAFFDALAPPSGGDSILAVSFTSVFVDSNGNPTDINGDNLMDTAWDEVYYNDNFAWGIDTPLPLFDVQTVALHENGHSLELGHFGPPPVAVMNPVYAGIRQSPFPTDHAGMCGVWGSWPK